MAGNLAKIVKKRSEYTGESHCRARDAILATSRSSPPIPLATAAQAEFEAEILDRIGYGISPQDRGTGECHPFGIVTAVPQPDRLELVLAGADDPLSSFLHRLPPIWDRADHNLSGVPGLRFETSKRGLVLRRRHAGGVVVLRDVTEARVEEAIERVFGGLDPVRFQVFAGLPCLHQAEEEHIERSARADPSGDAVLSGILRRANMFRARSRMEFVDLWCNDFRKGLEIHIEWAGELSHLQLVRRFQDPLFGLPLDLIDPLRCYCEPCLGDEYSVVLGDARTGGVTVHLRRNSVHERHLAPRRAGRCEFAALAGVDHLGRSTGGRRGD